MNQKKSTTAHTRPLKAVSCSNAGFNLIESLVVLATIGVLVFITVPILRVYLFEEKKTSAPVYIEKRGTSSSVIPSSDGRIDGSARPEASSETLE